MNHFDPSPSFWFPLILLGLWLSWLLFRLSQRWRMRARDARLAATWPAAAGRIVRSGAVWTREVNPAPEILMPGADTQNDAVDLRYVFEVNGEAYEGHTASPRELSMPKWGIIRTWRYNERFPAGSGVTVRYDPEDPTRNCADPAAAASGQTQE